MENKVSNIDLYNKTGFSDIKKGTIFSNIYIVLIITIIALVFIGIAAYYIYIKYVTDSTNILNNKGYTSLDIQLNPNVFFETTKSVNDCINICNADITCDGITYNSDTKMCTGVNNGKLTEQSSNYSAWVKPIITIPTEIKKNFSKFIIVGNANGFKSINGVNLQQPYTNGYFCYSFNLKISDFYKNYGNWRHVFHKGSQIDTGKVLSYQSWENLILDFPIQSIGVWLAPFTNNLRIAVTTESLGNRNKNSYPQAFVQKCDTSDNCYITDMPSGKWVDREKSGDGSIETVKIDTFIEYFDHDLQNIPINKQLNISINFIGRDVEIYYNGKIVKIARLDGTPKISNNKSNIYVMNDNTFCGNISNLLYYPNSLLLQDIQDIIALAPSTN